MSIDLNENYYVAICDNGYGKCHISEDYYRTWNNKCSYGRDGGVYCTANFKFVESIKDEVKMLEIKQSEYTCISCCDKSKKAKKISIKRAGSSYKGNNIVSFSLCDECLNKLAIEFYKI